MSQLYQTFNCNIPKTDIKKIDKINILNAVKKLNYESSEMFFLLIYEHYIRNNEVREVKVLTPYGSKYSKEEKTITFNLSSFPIPLRHILMKFINMIQSK